MAQSEQGRQGRQSGQSARQARSLPIPAVPAPPPPPPPSSSPSTAQTQSKRPSRWGRFLGGLEEVAGAFAAGSPVGMAQYAVNGIEEEIEASRAAKRGDPPPPPLPSESSVRPDGTRKGFWERFDEFSDEASRTYHSGGLLADPERRAEADARIRERQAAFAAPSPPPPPPPPPAPSPSSSAEAVLADRRARMPQLFDDTGTGAGMSREQQQSDEGLSFG